MRKVVKDFDKKPLVLTKQETLDHLKIIIESKDSKKIRSDFYRGKYDKEDGTKGDAVVEELSIFYHTKCAYCEVRGLISIDHYRPKGRIEGTTHKGYFWLCYEWSNLLPSCHDCNSRKGTKFPVRNTHIQFKDCLINQELDSNKIHTIYLNQIEKPYLLNPEIDEPKSFLGFEIDSENKGIAIKGLDGANGRGYSTLNICDLNRESLLKNRKEFVVNQIIDDLQKLFGKLSKRTISNTNFMEEIKDIFHDLEKKSQDSKRSFTLLRWFVIDNENNFNDLVISQLKDPLQQNITLAYFKAYKNNKL